MRRNGKPVGSSPWAAGKRFRGASLSRDAEAQAPAHQHAFPRPGCSRSSPSSGDKSRSSAQAGREQPAERRFHAPNPASLPHTACLRDADRSACHTQSARGFATAPVRAEQTGAPHSSKGTVRLCRTNVISYASPPEQPVGCGKALLRRVPFPGRRSASPCASARLSPTRTQPKQSFIGDKSRSSAQALPFRRAYPRGIPASRHTAPL